MIGLFSRYNNDVLGSPLLLGVSVPMPDPWLTFAPLQPAWILPTEINLSYHFSDQVSLWTIPEWIRQADTVDELRPQLCEKIETDGSRHCIGVE